MGSGYQHRGIKPVKKRKHPTTRSIMRKIMAEHPDGIGVMVLKKLVLSEYMVVPDQVSVMLCHMHKAKMVKKLKPSICGHCGRKMVMYKLEE